MENIFTKHASTKAEARATEAAKIAEIDARYEFMMTAVRHLGELAWQHINDGLEMHLKPDGTKVTTADLALNDAFIEMVKNTYEGDLVWGEEKSNSEKNNIDEANKNWMWLIDPIDGTSGFWRSYQNGKNYENSCANIMVTGFAPGETKPTMSVISNPFVKPEIDLSAVHGKTYYNNGWWFPRREISVDRRWRFGSAKTLDDVVSFEENWWNGSTPDLRNLEPLMPNADKIGHPLFLGSIALADVELSAFPSPSNPHDVAPGALIVHNAGGTIKTFKNEDYEDVDWRIYPINGVVGAQTDELAEAFIDKVNLFN